MAKSQLTLGITDDGVISYSMPQGAKTAIKMQRYEVKRRAFDEDYFSALKEIFVKIASDERDMQGAETAIVIPDNLIATDIVEIPLMRGLKPYSMLGVTIKNLYKNQDELKINKTLLNSGKQTAIFSLSMIRNEIYAGFQKAAAEAKMTSFTVTNASSAAVNGAIAINGKLKNATFIFLDIRSGKSTFTFVNKGRAIGYYRLPFGYEMLSPSRVISEPTLFRHSTAELAVANAKEKARAKKLTMEMPEDTENPDELEESDDFETAGAGLATAQAEMMQKGAKKIPKTLIRPTPEDEAGYLYENFRIYEKWALNIIRANPSFVAAGRPEEIYVNLPSDYDAIYERVNESRNENGVTFVKLDTHTERDIIANNIEYYGGFFTSQYNKNNNF